MRMRLVGGVVVVVALAAIALVVLGGGGGGPAKLPIVVTGAGAGGGGDGATREMAAGAPAADMMLRANIIYRAGDDLPHLGGNARAYRIDSTGVDVDDVRALAAAFGLEGGVTTEGSSWQLIDGDSQITVFREGAVSWSYSATGARAIEREASAGAGSGAGATGSGSGCAGPDCSVSSSATPADSDAAIDSAGGADVKASPPVTEPQRPADLPSQKEAERIALDLFEKIGGDRDEARVQSQDGITNWSVTIDPTIDGLPVVGLGSYFAVGADGAIEWASGSLGTPKAADEYPLIDTRKAIDQLNDPAEFFGMATDAIATDDAAAAREATLEAQPNAGQSEAERRAEEEAKLRAEQEQANAAKSGEATTTVADVCIAIFPPPPECGGGSGGSSGSSGSSGSPAADGAGSVDPAPPVDSGPAGDPGIVPPVTEPAEMPEPTVITLTGAERGLMLYYSIDGRDVWLVPAYLLESDQGADAGPVVALAIGAEHIRPPTASREPGGQSEPDAKPMPPEATEVRPLPAPAPAPDDRRAPTTTVAPG